MTGISDIGNKGQTVTPTESVDSSSIQVSLESDEVKLARQKYEEHYAKRKAIVEGDGKDKSGKKRSSLAWLYEWIEESRQSRP